MRRASDPSYLPDRGSRSEPVPADLALRIRRHGYLVPVPVERMPRANEDRLGTGRVGLRASSLRRIAEGLDRGYSGPHS